MTVLLEPSVKYYLVISLTPFGLTSDCLWFEVVTNTSPK